MTGADLLDRVRLALRDQVKPYLFSDNAIFSYLTEGQIIFCRRTHSQMDFTSFSVSTESGTNVYYTNARVLKVYGARINGQDLALYPGSAEQYELAFNSSSGMPTGFSSSFNYKYIAFNSVPDAVYEVNIAAAVLPENAIDETNDPVIPEEWHYLLAHYAVSQLPRHVDADVNNPQAAIDADKDWNKGLRDAKREIYNHRAGDKVVFPKTT